MPRPLIQIGDLVREMTEAEHAAYLEAQKNAPAPFTSEAPPPE